MPDKDELVIEWTDEEDRNDGSDDSDGNSYFANTEIFPFFRLEDVPHPTRD